MITVQLPQSTLVEQERLQSSQNEVLRAKQELQWQELQAQQQHERIARERCIAAILAAHNRERVLFDELYQVSEEAQSDASHSRELLHLTIEACHRALVISASATALLVAYVRYSRELGNGMLSRLRIFSAQWRWHAVLGDLRSAPWRKRKTLLSEKRKTASHRGRKRTRALSSCMKRARASHRAP